MCFTPKGFEEHENIRRTICPFDVTHLVASREYFDHITECQKLHNLKGTNGSTDNRNVFNRMVNSTLTWFRCLGRCNHRELNVANPDTVAVHTPTRDVSSRPGTPTPTPRRHRRTPSIHGIELTPLHRLPTSQERRKHVTIVIDEQSASPTSVPSSGLKPRRSILRRVSVTPTVLTTLEDDLHEDESDLAIESENSLGSAETALALDSSSSTSDKDNGSSSSKSSPAINFEKVTPKRKNIRHQKPTSRRHLDSS